MKETTSKYGKRFDEEFQRDAVRMLESGERSIGQLSQELGVSTWRLHRWSKLQSGKDKTWTGGSLFRSKCGSCEVIGGLDRDDSFFVLTGNLSPADAWLACLLQDRQTQTATD